MAFYNKKQLYLGTDASDVSLGANFLPVRDRIQFSRNEVPNNV